MISSRQCLLPYMFDFERSSTLFLPRNFDSGVSNKGAVHSRKSLRWGWGRSKEYTQASFPWGHGNPVASGPWYALHRTLTSRFIFWSKENQRPTTRRMFLMPKEPGKSGQRVSTTEEPMFLRRRVQLRCPKGGRWARAFGRYSR